MEIIEHKNIKSFITFGDIHGEFSTFFNTLKKGLIFKTYKEDTHPLIEQEKLEMEEESTIAITPRAFSRDSTSFFNFDNRKMYDFSNKIIFVCGDCGLGFNKLQYYNITFKVINDILASNGTFLYFIRGNHDDPTYFKEDKLGFSNIKCLSDYTVVKIKNENILCVGGGISIDRIWRKQQENVINKYKSAEKKKKLYWEDEAPIFDEDKLNKIIESNIKITNVVSHSAPSFVEPTFKDSSLEWYKIDPTLKDDVVNERLIFDKIFDFLKSNNMEIKTWSYGHFHQEYSNMYEDKILFSCLSEMKHIPPLSLYNNLINLTKKKIKMNKLDVEYSINEIINHVDGNVTAINIPYDIEPF